MTPFPADVRQRIGDLGVIQRLGQRRHVQLVPDPLDRDGVPQAMQDHAHQTLFRSQHPFGIDQRRRQAFLTVAMGLMAGTAQGRIQLATALEAGFGRRRQRLHLGGRERVGTGRLAGPEIERVDLLDPLGDLGSGGSTQRGESLGLRGQTELFDLGSRSALGSHRNQTGEPLEQGRQRPFGVFEFRGQIQGRGDVGRTPGLADTPRQLGHQRRMILFVGAALGIAEQLREEGQLASFEAADRRIPAQGRGRTRHQHESHGRIGRRSADVAE